MILASAAVIVPPPHEPESPFGVATTRPDGRLSLNATPVNATAPHPVTGRELATTLGHVLGRPAILPVPAAALRLAFGEMADVAILSSARVLPARLQESGFGFRHPDLEGALRFLLGRPARP